MKRMGVFLFFLSMGGGLPLPSYGEGKPVTYGSLSVEGLRGEMVHVAAQIQEFEGRAFDIETTLHDLQKSLEEKRAALDIQEGYMRITMQSIMHLSQTSPLLATLMHRDPNDVVRTGILLKTIVPELKARSIFLQQQVSELTKLKQKIEQQKLNLAYVRQELVKKQYALSQLIGYKSKVVVNQPKVEIDMATIQSSSMPELLAKVRQNKELAKFLKQSIKELTLQPPVPGKILTMFDRDKTFNPYGKGVVIQTRSGAQVVSPTSGTVVFAGPFRGYGNILILGSGKEYHIIMAGFDSIQVAVGQEIVIGEPVGVMATNTNLPKLYLEVRKKTETIDPTPWVVKWNQ